jgi:hypothetical protein
VNKTKYNDVKRSHMLVAGLVGVGVLFLLLQVLVPAIGFKWAALVGIGVGFPFGYIGANVHGFFAGFLKAAEQTWAVLYAMVAHALRFRPLLLGYVVVSLLCTYAAYLLVFVGIRMFDSQVPLFLEIIFFAELTFICWVFANPLIIEHVISYILSPYLHHSNVKQVSHDYRMGYKVNIQTALVESKQEWLRPLAKLFLNNYPIVRMKENPDDLCQTPKEPRYSLTGLLLLCPLPLNRTTAKFMMHVFIMPWIHSAIAIANAVTFLSRGFVHLLRHGFYIPHFILALFALVHSDKRVACGLDVLVGGFSAYALYHNLLGAGWIAQSQLTLGVGTLLAMILGLLFAHMSCKLVDEFKKLSSIELDLT